MIRKREKQVFFCSWVKKIKEHKLIYTNEKYYLIYFIVKIVTFHKT